MTSGADIVCRTALLPQVVCVATLFIGTAHAGVIPTPDESELSHIVGRGLSSGFRKVEWKDGTLPTNALVVYAVEQPRYDAEFLKHLATFLGVKGTPVRMPPDFIGAPGYWIKESDPTNALRFRSVLFSEIAGYVSYGSGEDNHRWDLKNHRPLANGVPAAEEALKKTLALLPVLGLTTNDLEYNPDGTLKWSSSDEGTSYTDQADGKRKRYVRQVNIVLHQRMPAGGSTVGVGTGGQLRAGYISEGKLAELEVLFRRVKPSETVKARRKSDVISALRKGRARTFYEHIPETLIVTNCAVAYPQGNLVCKQDHVWPFYSVKGYGVEGGETNAVIVYLPVAW